ncbi:hypothetical protein A3I51_03135 [Candidatus Gottesmanbacteria bacterium RIFCSPLOWO2_02_FULL_38_8]|uniref:Uncharacterized protein n=1 Tax=Candidatus Gottesmanbacteria bacterium RIFCSPLOWO2_02_FULL_38_8 TaxID=1798397 RepID=A0A1F6B4G8_9BACT|nr:MAG: hypothetical protein A3I51_03135 [Candidatus Gottesmanbacteria bacterium RIFCSPLOWO2_02_FULL_38_8]
MSGKYFYKFRNFLYPHFSELELTTLFYLLVLAIWEFRTVIARIIIDLYLLSEESDKLSLLLGEATTIAAIVFFFILVAINSVKKRKITFFERGSFSFFFYVILSVITLISIVLNFSSLDTDSLWKQFEGIMLVYLFIRSLITITLTIIFSKMGRDHVYATQMTDEQLNITELILIILLSTYFYFSLRIDHVLPTSLSLAYFYTITIISFYRYLANAFGILNARSTHRERQTFK